MTNVSLNLEQLPLFQGIPAAQLQPFLKNATGHTYAVATTIYKPGKSVDHVYVLQSGEISLYYEHFGKYLILDTLRPGDVFGNLNLTPSSMNHVAETGEHTVVISFPRAEFFKFLSNHPTSMLSVMQTIQHRLENYEEKMKSLVYDAKEKILHQLELLEERKHKYAKTLLAPFMNKGARVTHDKLAKYTGLTRETVTRAIQDLKKEGKVLIDAKGMVLLNCKDCIAESGERFF